jgi:protease-4
MWPAVGVVTLTVMLMGVALPRAWAQDAGAPATAAPATSAPAASPADAAAEAQPQEALVGWLELSESLRDAPPPFAWVSEEEMGPTLSRVLRQLDTVAAGDRYAGVVLKLDRPDLSLSQVQEIAARIATVRAAGKKVIAFAEEYDLLTYLLACSADTIVLQRHGSVMLQGLGVEEMYLAGLLEKIGLKADFIQVGKFKGAEEPLTRTAPSPEWSQNMDALLDGLYEGVRDQIAAGRHMTADQVEAMFADSWTMTDDDFVRRRVVDRVADRDLLEVTEVEFGDHFAWDDSIGTGDSHKQAATNPFMFFSTLFQESKRQIRRPTIALIHALGPITSGESTYGDGLFGEDSIGSRTLVEALSDAADNEQVKGVVIRIDSPGGSAIASEVIWQAVRHTAQDKPVFVSIGSMAASGGYYIACAGDEVYVAPGSIVGSIGVVGGKIIMGGLYDMLGVGVTRRSRGPLGDMFNSVEPFTETQRTALGKAFENTYQQFKQRVAIGRGARIVDVDAVAQGRLFTGVQAVQRGMVDKIGGLDLAVTDLADQVGLGAGQYDVVSFPEPMSLPQFLQQVFGVRARGVGVRMNWTASGDANPVGAWLTAARTTLGQARWRSVRPVLAGLMLLQREPVLTLLPTAIVVK